MKYHNFHTVSFMNTVLEKCWIPFSHFLASITCIEHWHVVSFDPWIVCVVHLYHIHWLTNIKQCVSVSSKNIFPYCHLSILLYVQIQIPYKHLQGDICLHVANLDQLIVYSEALSSLRLPFQNNSLWISLTKNGYISVYRLRHNLLFWQGVNIYLLRIFQGLPEGASDVDDSEPPLAACEYEITNKIWVQWQWRQR